jgi:hypothetical protein
VAVRYRVIQPARNRNETPVEALRLAEDIAALELAIRLLRSVDSANITDSDQQSQRDRGRDVMRTTVVLLQSWLRYARLKLRTEYLK